MGPIHLILGDRVIYDSALPWHAKVAAIINDGSWSWPVSNSDEFFILLSKFLLNGEECTRIGRP